MLVPFLHRLASRENLSREEARSAMQVILSGADEDAVIGGFLVALHMKGETADELTGFAEAMRAKAQFVDAGTPLLDTCGTGGDGSGTFNISTIAAFVIAGAGVRVAKHGNRSASSAVGSADILEALGVRIDLDAVRAAQAIRDVGIGFMFAPLLHPAMRNAHAARRQLRMRTVFNLLGPLVNPARATHQVIGAPSHKPAGLLAEALARLGTDCSLVVHGAGGLDEVSTIGPTSVWEIRHLAIRKFEWTPADFGVGVADLNSLQGGGVDVNRAIAEEVLAGVHGPRRDIVLVNAAAGLLASGMKPDLKASVEAAAHSIDSGAARDKLDRLKAFTNGG